MFLDLIKTVISKKMPEIHFFPNDRLIPLLSNPKAFLFGLMVLASLHWRLFTSKAQNAEEKGSHEPFVPGGKNN